MRISRLLSHQWTLATLTKKPPSKMRGKGHMTPRCAMSGPLWQWKSKSFYSPGVSLSNWFFFEVTLLSTSQMNSLPNENKGKSDNQEKSLNCSINFNRKITLKKYEFLTHQVGEEIWCFFQCRFQRIFQKTVFQNFYENPLKIFHLKFLNPVHQIYQKFRPKS